MRASDPNSSCRSDGAPSYYKNERLCHQVQRSDRVLGCSKRKTLGGRGKATPSFDAPHTSQAL